MLKDPIARIEVKNLLRALLRECLDGVEQYRNNVRQEEYINSIAGIRLIKILWKELLGEELEAEKEKKKIKPS